MTIQEAIKSGNRFRRKGESDYRYLKNMKAEVSAQYIPIEFSFPNIFKFTWEDALADDWEIEEEEKICVSFNQLLHATEKVRGSFARLAYDADYENFIQLCKELGFTHGL